jgi:hypothetical protein
LVFGEKQNNMLQKIIPLKKTPNVWIIHWGKIGKVLNLWIITLTLGE